jgi:hypothetical protein
MNTKLISQLLIGLIVEISHLHRGSRGGDTIDHRALPSAITTPHASQNEHIHLSLELSGRLNLSGA